MQTSGTPQENEGRAVVRRWKFLLVSAGNEDQARELAGQIRREAPPGAAVITDQARRGLAVHCRGDHRVQRMRTPPPPSWSPRLPPGSASRPGE